MGSIRVGVDIGGTFTDVAVLDEEVGSIRVSKVPTTARNFVDGFLNGIQKLHISARDTSYIIHGTTVATNAVVQRKLPTTAMLMTRGFRDILEIMRGNRPTWGLYDIRWKKPTPIIPRHLRYEISERVDYKGRVVEPLDEKQALSVIAKLKELDVRSVAVCLLFSNVNPSHERRIGELILQELPDTSVSLSSEVNPEVREYERTSTVAIDASVKPVVADYLQRLERALLGLGFDCPLMIMRSGGGMMSSKLARDIPIHTIESGPAGGVIGSANLATTAFSTKNLLAIDMGGTTFKVSLIEEGKPRLKSEGEVEWGVPYRIPMIDLSEIGSGGGSIAWIDRGGILRVGPQSAGADPGPVCYRSGGTNPTFTDASLVLGRINTYLLGGDMKLDVKASEEAIRKEIATPLGMDVLEAASGIIKIAEANMLGSMRLSSVQRGYDPRDFVTVAYGGAGPLVATSMAKELGSPSVLIPPHSGIFSAIGMLYSDMRLDQSQTFMGRLDSIKLTDMNMAYEELESKSLSALREEGFKGNITILRSVDARYVGQNFEVGTPVPSGQLVEARRQEIIDNFNREHRRLYAHSKPDEPIEVLTLRVAAIGSMLKPTTIRIDATSDLSDARRGERDVYFEETDTFQPTPVFERTALGAGASLTGPAIIEEMDSTAVVRPNQTALVDDFGNLCIKLR